MRRFTSGPKPSCPRLRVEVAQPFRVLGAVAVADAVVAGEVGRGLCGRDDVVGRQRVAGMWQRHLPELRAEPLVRLRRRFHRGPDLGVHAVDEVLARHADAHSGHARLEICVVVGRVELRGGGVARVVPGDDLQQRRHVAHRPGHGPDLVERAGVGEDPVTGHAAVGGLQPHGVGEGRGLSDGAAGVRPQRAEALARRHRRRRAARGAAGRAREIPRVAGGPIRGGLVGRAHRELVLVELAEDGQARRLQQRDGRGVIRRDEALQDPRPGGGLHALGAEVVLHRDGDAVERTRGVALTPPAI